MKVVKILEAEHKKFFAQKENATKRKICIKCFIRFTGTSAGT